MIHLTPPQISSFLDGELAEASAEIVRLHLDSCEECTLAFARAEEQAEQLARVLTHDPGAEYFVGFASEVEDLIRTGNVDPRTKPRKPEPEVEAFAQPPPEPQAEPPPEPQAEPMPEPVRAARRRESDRRPVPAIPWYVAAILVVIAGSVGVMVSRSPMLPRPAEEAPSASEPTRVEPAPPEQSPVETPTPEPVPVAQEPAVPRPVERTPPSEEPTVSAAEKETEPELLVPEPMRTLMPVTRIVTVVETTGTAATAGRRAVAPPSLPTGAPAAPVEPDPFATLLAELLDRVRAAQRASAYAAEDPTALNYEAAAARWEDVVSDLRGHAAQPRARFQLASARYRAWEMHPNAQRAAAAVASLRLYLVFAAPGAERNSAKAWLARLSH